jgi:hypothetical protein
MTTLGRSKSALLVIDVQNQVVEGAYNKDAVIAQINVPAAVLVSELNASFYENELPGRKADAMVVDKVFA